MGETIRVNSIDALTEYRATIMKNLETGLEQTKMMLETTDTLTFFKNAKFERTVIDPLSGKSENLIEVINQCHTYLVSLMAAEYLLKKYSGVSFSINLGNISGYDIESDDAQIIAECFAATSYKSNSKLTKDLKRLSENQKAIHKYEFFFDKEFTEKSKEYYQKKYPDIEIVKYSDIR